MVAHSPEGDVLALDLGTGSARAALVDAAGRIRDLVSRPLTTHHPRHGWVEQEPAEWWTALSSAIAELVSRNSERGLAGVCGCGHMHAPVLIDDTDRPTRPTAMLWNDKRATGTADALNARLAATGGHARFANPATSAWPGVKLAWLAEHDPGALEGVRALLMPKDYINFRLCGETAMDWTEAGSSFLMDPASRDWSTEQAAILDVDPAILAPLVSPWTQIGAIHGAAAKATGLPVGLPVFAGGGDYPIAIAGSGAIAPGAISDITGTSYLLTAIGDAPVIDPAVMNVMTVDGSWGAFAVVDAAGDAIRWARRMVADETTSFETLSRMAADVPPGAEGLIFLPYLTGERLGDGATSRASFVGLSAHHGPAHVMRAVMEGVALAMRHASGPIWTGRDLTGPIIAAAGGRRSDLWLQIKASVFDLPIRPSAEPESGLMGCAAIAQSGLGHYADVTGAITAMTGFTEDVYPNASLRSVYDDLLPVFEAAKAALRPVNQQLSARASCGPSPKMETMQI
jgi:xylulokinase